MATEDPKKQPVEPPLAKEISPPEDPLRPMTRASVAAASPFVNLLDTTDSVLKGQGGIANLSVYSELLRDDQVSSTWGQRHLSLTSCETVVEPGGTDAASKSAADALKEELDALPWDDITEKALFARFFGWGVAEVMWRPEGSRVAFDAIKVRDRGRFRFDRERGLHLWTLGTGWVRMPDRKFWCPVAGGDNHDVLYGLGLAHSLYWPVFFKRNDIKFWLIFLEKFGMPTAVAKLTSAQLDDPEQRAKAITMLRQIATDAGVVVPADVNGAPVVELLEAARSGAVDYAAMHKAMNEAISKVVVGQTMTTDNGSSKSQAEVHEGVARRLIAADSDLLCGSFNEGPVRWWTEWNFPGALPPRVYRQTAAPEDMNQRAERDGKIHALGFDPTEQYIRETYGEGWKKREVQQPPAMRQPGMPGAGAVQDPGNADGEQFAEESAALAALKAARRGDQQALAQAAMHFAEQYQSVVGRQVGAILQAAEDSGDPELFRQRLDELLEQGPSPEAVEKVGRASLFSFLLGRLRNQRRSNNGATP